MTKGWELAMWGFGRRAPAEGTPGAKTLTWKYACLVPTGSSE